MAEDRLVVGVGADLTGLDAGLVRGAARVQQFADVIERVIATLPPINLNAGPANKSLQETQAILSRLVKEARDVQILPSLGTAQARKEVAELATAFEGVNAAIAHMDPSGIMRRVATDTALAVAEMQKLQGVSATGAAPDNASQGGLRVIRDKVAELKLLSGQMQQVSESEAKVGTNAALMAEGWANASRTLSPMTAQMAKFVNEAQNVTIAVSPMAAAMTQAARASTGMILGMSAVATPFNGAAAAIGGVTTGLGHANRAASLARTSLVALASQGVGVTSMFGRLAESAILIGAGSTGVLAAAGAVIVLSKAWELFTAGQAQAKKAAEDLTEALKHQREAQKGPVVTAQEAFSGQRKEVERLSVALAQVVKQRQTLAAAPQSGPPEAAFAKQLSLLHQQADLTTQLAEASDLLRVAQVSKTEADAAAIQRGNDLVASLALQVGTFGMTATAAQQVAVAMDTTLTDAQRNAAIAALGTLDALERQKKALEDAKKAAEDAAKSQAEMTAAFNQFWDDIDAKANLGSSLIVQKLKDIVNAQHAAVKDKLSAGIDFDFSKAQGNLDLVERAFQNVSDEIGKTNKVWRKFVAEVNDARTPAEKFSDTIHDITHGLDQVLQRDGIRLIGEDAAQALGSVLNLGDALGDLVKSASTGNVLAAIGAGVGLISQAFGQSPLDKEHDDILKQNNQRLAELRAGLDRQLRSVDVSAAARVLATQHVLDVSPVTGFRQSDDFNQALSASGLSILAFAKIVEEATGGIKILDSEGHLIAESWLSAREALSLAIVALGKFSDNISDRAAQLALDNKIVAAGGGTPQSSLAQNRQLILDNSNLPGEIAARALDLTTEAGRAAYLEWVKQIVAMGKAGLFTTEQLENFPNADALFGPLSEGVDQLIQANQDAADKVQALADAAAAAAAAFAQQIPTLLKLQAQLSGVTDNAGSQFSQALSGLAFTAPDLAGMFSGFNLNDAASREALRKKILDMVQQMLSGQGGVDQLGITPEQFQPLLDFLGVAANALDSFAETIKKVTLAEEQSMLDLRAKLAGGADSPVAAFNRELRALATTAPDFSRMLGNFDLGDPASRAALRQKLLSIFDQVQSGMLTAEDLGLSADDFKKFLGDSADFLNSFSKEVQAATKSITNLPSAINLSAFEFQAQVARNAASVLPVLDPGLLPRRRGLGDAVNFTPRGGAAVPFDGPPAFTVQGDLNISIPGASTKTAQELFVEIQRQARRQSMVKFGNPDQRGRV